MHGEALIRFWGLACVAKLVCMGWCVCVRARGCRVHSMTCGVDGVRL